MNALESALATAGRDIVKGAEFVAEKVLPVLEKTAASASTVEAVTGLVDQSAAQVEKLAYSLLGVVINAINSVTPAAEASGLNISLDSTLVADIKAIAPAVTALVGGAKAA